MRIRFQVYTFRRFQYYSEQIFTKIKCIISKLVTRINKQGIARVEAGIYKRNFVEDPLYQLAEDEQGKINTD